MDDDGQVQLAGEFELGGEDAQLVRLFREVVVEVEARLADRHDLDVLSELLKLRERF